jgi:hypothetical protein
MVGYQSEKDFKNMVSSNMIRNCPVTQAYSSAANKIFGPGFSSMKGKAVRATQRARSNGVRGGSKRNSGAQQRRHYHSGRDVFRRTRVHDHFLTKDKRTKANLINSFKKVFEIYNQRGFIIKTSLMDREFDCLQDNIRGAILNTTATSEHVMEI